MNGSRLTNQIQQIPRNADEQDAEPTASQTSRRHLTVHGSDHIPADISALSDQFLVASTFTSILVYSGPSNCIRSVCPRSSVIPT
ncbi:hypothetical protein BCEP4_240068 [Burkholderia cepacia]|nr:hypothetical protein BCEP4_240068 [Burkholderia cepacia]